MTETQLNNKISLPNMLLIAGNGRNVGKTTLACRIISQLSKKNRVTGIKISSHLHDYEGEPLVEEKGKFVILEEKERNSKDSSRMLQAGASKVFYVMAKKEHLDAAFENLLPHLNGQVIVCESGGLYKVIQPGLFLFVNEKGRRIEKPEHLDYNPVHVDFDGTGFDFKVESIRFSEHQIKFEE